MLGKVLVLTAFALGATSLAPDAGPWGASPTGAPAPVQPARYAAPVPEPLRVIRGFLPPATPYGQGHLGVDIAAAPGEVVRSAGPGVVQFAGQVAGRGVVVVLHPDGLRTEYEPVRPVVRVGVHLRRGQPVGVVRGRHGDCPRSCLHWGARRGDAYVDPLDLLRPLGPVVLLPWTRPG